MGPGTARGSGELRALFGGGREERRISVAPRHRPCASSPLLQYRVYILTRPFSNLSLLKSSSPVPFSTATAALTQLGFL